LILSFYELFFSSVFFSFFVYNKFFFHSFLPRIRSFNCRSLVYPYLKEYNNHSNITVLISVQQLSLYLFDRAPFYFLSFHSSFQAILQKISSLWNIHFCSGFLMIWWFFWIWIHLLLIQRFIHTNIASITYILLFFLCCWPRCYLIFILNLRGNLCFTKIYEFSFFT